LDVSGDDDHPFASVETLVLVAVGGFAGATCRYVVGVVVAGRAGTLLANVLGSIALGFVVYEAVGTGVLSNRTRVALGTGFLSSFTTYSTFALESATATPTVAVGNVLANYGLGFAGVFLGAALARRVDGIGPTPAGDEPTPGGESR
jgi:CrcB protein